MFCALLTSDLNPQRVRPWPRRCRWCSRSSIAHHIKFDGEHGTWRAVDGCWEIRCHTRILTQEAEGTTGVTCIMTFFLQSDPRKDWGRRRLQLKAGIIDIVDDGEIGSWFWTLAAAETLHPHSLDLLYQILDMREWPPILLSCKVQFGCGRGWPDEFYRGVFCEVHDLILFLLSPSPPFPGAEIEQLLAELPGLLVNFDMEGRC